MLIKILEPDFVFENASGVLKQLVHDGWKQVNVISSVKNCTRGGHYHKFNDEAFYIISGKFRLIVVKDNCTETYEFKSGDMFAIPAFVKHTFEYLEDSLLISFYSKGVELSPTEKDLWS